MSQTFIFPVEFQAPVTASQGLTGTFFGDGSNLTGASLPGQSIVNTTVQSNSANWNTAYNVATAYQSVSGSFATDSLQTTLNHLSTNNVLISSLRVINNLTIAGDISGNNLKASFNQGTATGIYSFAEGFGTVASNNSSHAEGNNTIASGVASHAEGNNTKASGAASHAGGSCATAAHNNSYAWSDKTNVPNVSTTRTGQYMVSASGGMFIPGPVGIGTDSLDNALTVNGNVLIDGTLSALSAEFVNITNTFVSNITSLSTLEISGTLITYGNILSGNQNLTDIFVLNNSLNSLSGNWQTAYQQTSANDLVRSNSTFETPTTGISAVQNIVSLSQVTYDALTVKLPTTLYVIV